LDHRKTHKAVIQESPAALTEPNIDTCKARENEEEVFKGFHTIKNS
jgi:hypothetical protein